MKFETIDRLTDSFLQKGRLDLLRRLGKVTRSFIERLGEPWEPLVKDVLLNAEIKAYSENGTSYSVHHNRFGRWQQDGSPKMVTAYRPTDNGPSGLGIKIQEVNEDGGITKASVEKHV